MIVQNLDKEEGMTHWVSKTLALSSVTVLLSNLEQVAT